MYLCLWRIIALFIACRIPNFGQFSNLLKLPDWEWYLPMVCYIQWSDVESSQDGWHMGQEAGLKCATLFLRPVDFFSGPNNEWESRISSAQSNAQCSGASAHKPIWQSSYMAVPKCAKTHFGWWLCINHHNSAWMGTIDEWDIVQMGIGVEWGDDGII